MAETSFIIQNGRRLDLKDASARKQIGSCDELQTDVKHCLVHAINELNEKVANGVGGAGEKGDPGEDGVSCTHSWDGTVLTVTSASGTSSVDLKGAKGDPGNDGYTPVKGVDYFDGAAGATGQPGKDGTSATHSWNGTVLTVTSASGTSSANLKGERGIQGEQGVSGVYVGSGDMPDGYNVQIAPDGEGESLQDMIDAALQEAKDSGEFKGDKGDPGSPGKNGQDGTVSFDELTDSQKSQLVEGIVDDLSEEVQADLVSSAKISPSAVFASGSYAEMLSCTTFSQNSLKVFTVVEKNVQASGNYYGGHTFIGLYKDASNYLKLWTSAYNLVLDNVVAGKKTSTTITSIQSTVTPCSDMFAVIDLIRNKLELRGLNNGTMTLIVDVDLNTLDLSELDSFKLLCGAGKYSGYQANIYARINDYFDYTSLMNQQLYMSNYNCLPVVDTDNTEIYDATSVVLDGTITSTISATHKISDVTASPNGYFAFGAVNAAIQNEVNWGEIVRFKLTNISDGLYFTKAMANTVVIWDEDGNMAYNGSGQFSPEPDKWYYKCAVNGRSLGYGANYNMYAYGTFTIELEGLIICKPKSQNMCAETWNGQFFTGALPFNGTNVSFISVDSFANTLTGKFIPVMAPNIDTAGNIRMYNGTKWIIIGNA